MTSKKFTVKQLKAMAKERGLKGYSKLRKAELLELLGLSGDAPAQKAPAKKAEPAREITAEEEQGEPVGAADTVGEETFLEPPGEGYGTPLTSPPPPPPVTLPESYGQDLVALIAREPGLLFAWWDLSGIASRRITADMDGPRPVLRVEKVGRGTCDIEVGDAWNWYLESEPGSFYQVAIGFKDQAGTFREVALSRKVQAPSLGLSSELDAQWMLVDETARKLLEYMGGFPTPGSPGVRIEKELHKLLISSPGIQKK